MLWDMGPKVHLAARIYSNSPPDLIQPTLVEFLARPEIAEVLPPGKIRLSRVRRWEVDLTEIRYEWEESWNLAFLFNYGRKRRRAQIGEVFSQTRNLWDASEQA